MRFALPAVLIALTAAAPALATGGYQCRPVSGAGPSLSVVTGRTVAPVVVQASIVESGRTFTTAGEGARLSVAQSWIDEDGIKLDLIDAQATRFEARLRARFVKTRFGREATGTLSRGGRVYRVRCAVDV
ncbi:MAG TPA: hypothetical protein VGB62_03235 [Allosphingosinicella sp.]|jgi:hypothetical protein